MKVNRKRNGGHHLPCLSGLSQTPLIADNGSERSTQITAHSLSLRSPTIITSHQQQHSQPHQAVPISSTPQLPHSSASINLPGANIFFPPLPPRSSSNKSQQLMFETNINATNDRNCNNKINNDVNISPKDFNMNVEHERNREHILSPINQQTLSPSHVRLPGSDSSTVNTPLSVPPDTFCGFFPESQQTFAQQQLQLQQQHQQPSRRSSTTPNNSLINKNTNNVNGINNWPQQQQPDENYHLYHEPMDPDEQADSKHTSQASSKNHSPNMPTMSNISMRLDSSLSSVPPPPRPRSNLSTTGPTSKPDLPLVVNSCEGSPSMRNSNNHLATASQIPTSSTSFTERVGERRDDVSEDIYHRYVTLKSNERSNHRSRSYHGPKNNNNHNNNNNNNNIHQTFQLSPLMGAPKNLSSNSVAELQMSPTTTTTVSSRRIMPIQFRDHCVRELIETESNYVHALEMIIVGFADRIKILLDKDQDKLIFGHIRNFHHIHSLFQADLVKAACRIYNKDLPKLPSPKRNSTNSSKPSTPTLSGTASKDLINASPLSSPKDLLNSPQLKAINKSSLNGNNDLKISTCFLNIKEKLLKYGEYCAQLSKAQALLDELTSKNETIAVQLERCQQEANEGKFKLRDLLSLPMQRILKYHLLLAQLIKNTNSSYEDYQGLKRAHEAMVDLGQYINEVKRDSEAIQIINDIESSIIGLNMPANTQLTDYGRLVMDGFLRVKVLKEFKPKVGQDPRKLPHDTKVKQKRYVFVFDKVMLITLCKTSIVPYMGSSGASTCYYNEALVFSEYELDLNPRAPTSETLAKHATRDKWCFDFNLIRMSDRSVYCFYLKSQDLKNKWVSAIQKAMDNTRPASSRQNTNSHEFLMHTFEKPSSCDHCGKLLLGLLYQGYRCRVCFTSVHKKCLTAIRPCGPALPPKNTTHINTLSHSHNRNNEPESPSVRSNCSDENAFSHFPVSNASSIQCMEALMKNEYTNVARNLELLGSPSSSFRDTNGTNQRIVGSTVSQRPVSSMINVSSQNSTNQLLQQKRLLGGSASTPVMNRDTCMKAKVISDFDGDEEAGELRMHVGQLIIVDIAKSSTNGLDDELDGAFSQLNLRASHQSAKMWYGKNIDTNKEGRFPADRVELMSSQAQIHEIEGSNRDFRFNSNHDINMHTENENINFLLKDKPWFLGRADRDEARALLQNMPNETFLVRASLRRNGSYAIDLKHDSEVKHMRVYVSHDGSQLYLSEARYFWSLLDLVSWYEQNSLEECFASLNARLRFPFKNCPRIADHQAQDLL